MVVEMRQSGKVVKYVCICVSLGSKVYKIPSKIPQNEGDNEKLNVVGRAL